MDTTHKLKKYLYKYDTCETDKRHFYLKKINYYKNYTFSGGSNGHSNGNSMVREDSISELIKKLKQKAQEVIDKAKHKQTPQFTQNESKPPVIKESKPLSSKNQKRLGEIDKLLTKLYQDKNRLDQIANWNNDNHPFGSESPTQEEIDEARKNLKQIEIQITKFNHERNKLTNQ